MGKSYIIYKPYGMLSQFTKEAAHHVTLADLDFNFGKDVYPVGRLDADSEGLLLLSSDKSLNKKILHPSKKQNKTYLVQVEGSPNQQDFDVFADGINIKIKGKIHACLPASARVLSESPDLPERIPPIRVRKNIPDTWVEITLLEGKNRQVRKMCASVGFPVLRLVRVSLSKWTYNKGNLKGLAVGEVREI